MNLDFAINHVLHRSRNRSLLRGVIANAELHYSGSLQESDFVTSNGLTYTNLQRYFNVVERDRRIPSAGGQQSRCDAGDVHSASRWS